MAEAVPTNGGGGETSGVEDTVRLLKVTEFISVDEGVLKGQRFLRLGRA
jgi:hypothetical protein